MGKKLVLGLVIVVVLLMLFHRSDLGPTSETASHPPSAAPSTFAGDDCAGDCSGHEAGYNWAEEHGIDDEDTCEAAGDRSNSPSFAEGCKAYVNGESSGTSDDGDDNQDDEDKSSDDQSGLLATPQLVSA